MRVAVLLPCAALALVAKPPARRIAPQRSAATLDSLEGVEAPKVKVDTTSGLRGLVATAPIKAGESLVSAKREQSVEVTDLEAKTAPRDLRKLGYCDDAEWKAIGWEGRLALLLLRAKVEKDATLAPWVAALPEAYDDVPAFGWSDADVSSCAYAPLRETVAGQRDTWARTEAALLGRDQRRPYGAADLRWALATVLTRSFSGPFEGTSPKQRFALIGFAAWLAVGYVVGGFGDASTAAQGFVAVSLGSVLSDYLVSKDESLDLQRHVLAPGVDFLNHVGAAAEDDAAASYEYFADAFAVNAHRDYDAGDEVHASYGKKSNAQLVANYGFLEPGNPFDDYVFPDAYPFPPLRGARVTRTGFDEATAKAAVAYSGSTDAARENLVKACSAQAAAIRATPSGNGLLDALGEEHAAILAALADATEKSAMLG